MKLKSLLLIIPLLFLTSCQPGRDSRSNSAFPKQMVGVWEAETKIKGGNKWGIKFEQDGSVNKIVHFLAGPVDLREGGVLRQGREESVFAFEFDPAQVEYSPEKKTVSVFINLTSYTMKMPAGTLEGFMEDRFTGPVSKDGKTWKAELRRYEGMKGATHKMTREEAASRPVPILFHKVDLKKPPKNQ